MPSFTQDIHVEEDVEERLRSAWDFKPSDGGPSQQNFVVMCVVAPEGTNQKCESLAIKIFGCFSTKDAADKYASKLSGECNTFDYFVATTQDWLKLPPHVESLDDVHYQESALTDIQQRLIDMRTARAKLMQERILADRASRKKPLIEEKKSDSIE